MLKIFTIIILLINLCFALDLHRTNSIVVDNTNKLLWQDDTSVLKISLNQQDATNNCSKLSYKGLKGWSVPTVKEYEAIVDKSNSLNYIHKAFKYNVPSGYWTKDTLRRMLGYYGYYMNFTNGMAYYENKTYKKYVRCVKDTQ